MKYIKLLFGLSALAAVAFAQEEQDQLPAQDAITPTQEQQEQAVQSGEQNQEKKILDQLKAKDSEIRGRLQQLNEKVDRQREQLDKEVQDNLAWSERGQDDLGEQTNEEE